MAETLESLAAIVAALAARVDALSKQLGEGRAGFAKESFGPGAAIETFRVEAPLLNFVASDLVLAGRHGGLARALVDDTETLLVNVAGDWPDGVQVESALGVFGAVTAPDFLISGPLIKQSVRQAISANRDDIRRLEEITVGRIAAIEAGTIAGDQLRIGGRLAFNLDSSEAALELGSRETDLGLRLIGPTSFAETVACEDIAVSGRLTIQGRVFGKPGAPVPFDTVVDFRQTVKVDRISPSSGRRSVQFDSELLVVGGGQFFGMLVVGDPPFDPTLPDEVPGEIRAEGAIRAATFVGPGGDVAEYLSVQEGVDAPPGTVMVIAADGKLAPCARDHDPAAAGVVAGAGGLATGLMLKPERMGGVPVSLTGTVYCNCDADQGAITPGDLLTTSTTTGCARRAAAEQARPGSILGKALSSLDRGRGQVLMLIMAR